jgi:S1-C subfamily serine protease
VVTNRHVVEGATRVEVTTYDGRDYVAYSSLVAPVADLALLTLDSVFTETATIALIEPSVGDPLSIVGYPLGQALTVEDGAFIGVEQDTLGAAGGDVWFINAHIEHGSSGSPVYDENGDVVGIVYAGDEDWDALAWPASSLQELIDDPSGWVVNTAPC